MRHYLILTHGRLADGFLDTLGMLAGVSENITAISAYVDNRSLEQLVMDYFETVQAEDEIVVFTDILGGSVNQYVTSLLGRKHFHVIAGVNLAAIIALVMFPQDQYLEENDILQQLENARQQLVYMNQFTRSVSMDDIEC